MPAEGSENSSRAAHLGTSFRICRYGNECHLDESGFPVGGRQIHSREWSWTEASGGTRFYLRGENGERWGICEGKRRMWFGAAGTPSILFTKGKMHVHWSISSCNTRRYSIYAFGLLSGAQQMILPRWGHDRSMKILWMSECWRSRRMQGYSVGEERTIASRVHSIDVSSLTYPRGCVKQERCVGKKISTKKKWCDGNNSPWSWSCIYSDLAGCSSCQTVQDIVTHSCQRQSNRGPIIIRLENLATFPSKYH